MPSWFSKAFAGGKKKSAADDTPKEEVIERRNPILDIEEDEDEAQDDGPKLRGERNIIEPTILLAKEERGPDLEHIAIKAKLAEDRRSCTLLIDRPILERYSAWFTRPEDAADSPLAQAIFALKGIGQVTIHGMTIVIAADHSMDIPWVEQAGKVAEIVREHLKAGKPVVTPDFFESLPSEDAISTKLDTLIKTVINPEIAGHSGAISLERVEGNTVFIQMMGGCQGCAASDITLKQGIHTTFKEAVPAIGAIYDETNHSAGDNPYFSELPAEMGHA